MSTLIAKKNKINLCLYVCTNQSLFFTWGLYIIYNKNAQKLDKKQAWGVIFQKNPFSLTTSAGPSNKFPQPIFQIPNRPII